MKNRKSPISTIIDTVGTITFAGCIIIGFILAFTYGIPASQNAKSLGVLIVILGVLLRIVLGFLIGLPSASILWAFAKIVAWYEAVPPGYAYGMQPQDDASAPAVRPVTYAPVPAKPQRTEDRDRSAVPVAHAPAPAQPVPPTPQYADEHDRSAVPAAHNEGAGHVPAPSVPSGRWKCPSCGAIQPGYFRDCRRCGASRPNAIAPAAPKPAPVKRNAPVATWRCSCGAENPVSRGTCDSCGGAKPFTPSGMSR